MCIEIKRAINPIESVNTDWLFALVSHPMYNAMKAQPIRLNS